MNLKHTVILALSFLSLTAAQAAAPLNDSAAKAIEAKGSYQLLPVVDLSTATATAATDPLLNGAPVGKTVWYKLPRTVNMPLAHWSVDIISSTGVGKAAFYRQYDPDNPFTSLHDGNSNASFAAGATITLNLDVGGSTCLLMVAGTGSVQVRHRLSVVANDFPSSAITLGGSMGTVKGDNSQATITADEPAQPAGISGFNLVWYKWTPTFTGAAAVDTNFSFVSGPALPGSGLPNYPHDTTLALYQSTVGGLALVAGDGNSGWVNNSRITFTAIAGVTYYIAVGTEGQTPGQFELNYYQANTAGQLYFFSSPPTEFYPSGDTTAYARETQGTCQISVGRRYAGAATTTCNCITTPGTAATGVDYQTFMATLGFPAPASNTDAAWQATANIVLLDDAVDENSETIYLTLSNPSNGAIITTANATIQIGDNDGPISPNDLYVDTPVIHVSEGDSRAYATLRRDAAGTAIQLLRFAGSGGATEGSDFTFNHSESMSAFTTSLSLETNIIDDSVFEDEETVRFSMVGGTYFTVVIEDDDPFIPLAGQLTAALDFGSRSSQCVATVSSTGAITGKLTLLGRTVPFATKLDLRGRASAIIPMKSRGSLLLQFEARDATGGYRLKLIDSQTNSTGYEEVVLANYSAKLNPCPEAGRYTVVSGLNNDVGVASTIVVNTLGRATAVGRLFDGTAFTMAGYIDGEGSYSSSASLYANQGGVRLSGRLPLLDGQYGSFSSFVTRPAHTGDGKMLASVTSLQPACYRYTPAANVSASLDSWSGGTGKATLVGGPLMNMLTKALTVNLSSIIAPADAEKLKLTVVPSSGVFSGSFVLPGTTKVQPFYGVLIDLPGANSYGKGFFFDGLKTGTITIGKP